jgi:hypothetical protein
LDSVTLRSIDQGLNGHFKLDVFNSNERRSINEKIIKSLEFKEENNISDPKWIALTHFSEKIYQIKYLTKYFQHGRECESA